MFDSWKLWIFVAFPVSILIAVITLARKHRRVVLPSAASYDYVVVGSGHAGCACAHRTGIAQSGRNVLLLEKTTGGQALQRGWGIYLRPDVTKSDGWGSFWGPGMETYLNAVEAVFPTVKRPLETTTMSPLSWASGLTPTCALPRIGMIHSLPNNVEVREGIDVVDVSPAGVVKFIGRGGKVTVSVQAMRAVFLCCGSKNVKSLVPNSIASRDVFAVPISFQAKPNLRMPNLRMPNLRASSMCDAIDVVGKVTTRFVPDSSLTGGCFDHAFSIIPTMGEPNDEAFVAAMRQARVLVATTKLQHLSTGKECIDVSLLTSVPRGLAMVVLYQSPSTARRRCGAQNALNVMKRITEEVATDEYLQRYVAAHRMSGGEPHGACPLGTVVDGCGMVVGTKRVYVADSSVVPEGITIAYGTKALGMAIAFRVADHVTQLTN